MHIDKAQIIDALRSRGLHDRANWVDREFPRLVDTRKNRSLLRMLDVEATATEPTKS